MPAAPVPVPVRCAPLARASCSARPGPSITTSNRNSLLSLAQHPSFLHASLWLQVPQLPCSDIPNPPTTLYSPAPLLPRRSSDSQCVTPSLGFAVCSSVGPNSLCPSIHTSTRPRDHLRIPFHDPLRLSESSKAVERPPSKRPRGAPMTTP